METAIGLARNAFISPWYGDLYDIFFTDQRAIFVFVRKHTRRSSPFLGNAEPSPDNSIVDLDVLASRKWSFSIPWGSVRYVQVRKSFGTFGFSLLKASTFHHLAIGYTEPGGKERQLKVLLIAPIEWEKVKFIPLAVTSSRDQYDRQRAYIEWIKSMLVSVLPENVARDALWAI